MPFKSIQAGDLTTSSSSAIGNQSGQNLKRKLSSKSSESGPSLKRNTISTTSAAFLTAQNSGGSPHPGNVSSSRKRKRSHVSSSSHNLFSSIPTPSISSSASGKHMPTWSSLPLNMLEPPFGSSTFMNGSGFTPLVQDPPYNNSGVTSASVEQRDVDEILKQFSLFKKFDTVEDYSDHHYAKQISSAKHVIVPFLLFTSPFSRWDEQGVCVWFLSSTLLFFYMFFNSVLYRETRFGPKKYKKNGSY